MTPTVGLLVALALVVVVPLGLPLLATPGLAALHRVWALVGAVAVVSLTLRPGTLAATLTVPYLVLAGAAAALALRRALTARTGPLLRELNALAAGVSLLVAAGCLTGERAGVDLLGFDGEVLALTVAHFHYAGFAVSLLAGLVLVRAPGRAAALGAAAVPAGTALVAVGHFAGRAVELGGAVVLATGVLALSLATIGSVRSPRQSVRRLLLVSVAVTPLTMAVAVWFALGRLTGLPHPDIALTAATHGVGNAVGLCLCGLLGWRLLRPTAL